MFLFFLKFAACEIVCAD